jgi:hypothetical protein
VRTEECGSSAVVLRASVVWALDFIVFLTAEVSTFASAKLCRILKISFL